MPAQKHQTISQGTEPLVTGNANDSAASSSLPEKTLIPLIFGHQEHNTLKMTLNSNPYFLESFFQLLR